MVPIPKSGVDPAEGKYIAFAGRISEEKGILTLFSAAARLPGMEVRVAGNGPLINELTRVAPRNVKFSGLLGPSQISAFYQQSRFLVSPSIWFETFGLVAAEAMSYGLPVIASRIGGLPEIVDDGITGFLFEAGNSEDLARKIELLWYNPDLCRQMGGGKIESYAGI